MDIPAEARALMNNEAFKKALESTQQDFINAAMSCDLKDDEGRRINLMAARIVTKVASYLAIVASQPEGEPAEMPDFYEERAKRRFALFSK